MNRSGAGNPNNNPLRSMNMNSYPGQQQQRPGPATGPRLQNANKGGIGNATALGGWSGVGGGTGFGGVGQAGGGGGGGGGMGRPGQLSGFAQVMGGGGQNGLDMSDFPTLSGGPRQAAPSAAASWNSASIRQTSAQHQQQQQQQQQQAAAQQAAQHQQRAPSAAPSQQSLDQGLDAGRSQQPTEQEARSGGGGGGDEFPPLAGPGQVNGDTSNLGSAVTSPGASQPPTAQQTQLPIREASNAAFQAPQSQQQTPIGPPQLPQSTPQLPQQNPASQPPATAVKRYADMTDDEKYGLAGLAAAFEARRLYEIGQTSQIDTTLPSTMRNALFLGQDLSLLGLDLDSPEPLYPTFSAFSSAAAGTNSFDYTERNVVPEFSLPPAYVVTNVPNLEGRMGGFSDETLFAIFYLHPRSTLQELASIELTGRDWRYHKLLRQWLQKDNPATHNLGGAAGAAGAASGSSSLPLHDFAQSIPVAAPPVRLGPGQEKGAYVFFNALEWRRERKEFVLDYGELEGRAGAAYGGSAMSNGTGVTAPAPGLPGPGQVSGVTTPAPGLSAPAGQIGAGA
ncbi:hypothetical protein D0869_02785 [Hortaea werneckii]|uniref:NOT2/NOT3/NOT5 C-terminal domain-containing protein n=1 Tax=Hortaea werneckii TaxID=91943 RepID=A0A3M7B909_HORWE|nr:hypothetical protein KC324_g4423 [Hortaea werneckii]KAI7576779.1 hypothetical protein KC316_g10552 [Hortaea werneckii]KAI7664205.1 hypothetical protein KC318_g7858 [Hortaea werneckii]RMX86855.1 hypothetical protein D0869_02785 [Hortaea werneckii]RMY08222.1 hypothetical protein D0868_04928 [Hortaea werneckii]